MSLLLAAAALAADPRPLFDLGLDLSTGLGVASPGLHLSSGPDSKAGLLARAGLGVTAWVTRDVGLGIRLDGGSYAAIPGDESNAFAFVEGRYRADRLVLGASVGVPIVYVEYFCIAAPCPVSPWEYHHPVAAVSASWDASHGALLVVPGVRVEAGDTRWGVIADLRFGVRASRPKPPAGGPELPRL